MRKKKIIEQNSLLFKQLAEAQQQVMMLKKQLSEKQTELSEKENTIISLKNDAVKNNNIIQTLSVSPEICEYSDVDTPNSEEVCEKFVFGDDIEYGGSVIGEIVLNSAKYSNFLTENGETRYRELVNLILGKAEVAKSDILAVVKSENELEWKKSEIDKIKTEAIEYFDSILAQRQ